MESEPTTTDPCMYERCTGEANKEQQLRVTNPENGEQMVMYVCPNHLAYITTGTRQGKVFSIRAHPTIEFPRPGQIITRYNYRIVEILSG